MWLTLGIIFVCNNSKLVKDWKTSGIFSLDKRYVEYLYICKKDFINNTINLL
jgi:hypothetical protein